MNYKLARDPKEVAEYTRDSDFLFLDTETTGLDAKKERIRLLQVKSPKQKIPILADLFLMQKENLMEAFKGKTLIFHNAKFDLSFLGRYLGKDILQNKIHDTFIAGKVFELSKKHSLKAMVKNHLSIEMEKESQVSDWSSNLTEKQLTYAANDVIYLEELFYQLNKKYNLKERIYALETAFIPLLVKMEIDGIHFDFRKALVFLEEKKEKYYNLKEDLQEDYGVDALSYKSVASALVREGVELPKTAKGNHSTKEDILKFIDHEIASKVIEVRKLKKEIELLEAYIKSSDDDSRIHSTFNSWKTVSGRLSSEDPNIQNVPRKKEFRELFGSKEGYFMVGADYPQIELRIAAVYTKDKTMIEAFKKGIDLHKLTVSKIMDIPYEEVTDEMRQLGKPINFGALYGMSAKTLMEYSESKYGVKMSYEEAKTFLKKYKQTYKGIAEWHDKTIRKIRKNGHINTETLMGRKMYSKRFTDALNHPIQGTGADMIKLAVIYFNKLCQKFNIDAKIVNIIHDEILVETNNPEKASKILKKAMELSAEKLIPEIPCPVEAKIGKNWYEVK